MTAGWCMIRCRALMMAFPVDKSRVRFIAVFMESLFAFASLIIIAVQSTVG